MLADSPNTSFVVVLLRETIFLNGDKYLELAARDASRKQWLCKVEFGIVVGRTVLNVMT
tara:strand:+ start:479 stop:655 length:177 start_codon:yes stop_codon:yes gene_type:complete